MTVEHPITIGKQLTYPSKAIFISVVLVALSSLFYASFVSLQTKSQLQRLTQMAIALEQTQTDRQTLINQQIDRITKAQTQLQQTVQKNNKNLTTALQERWYQNNDWLLLKIRYYLELSAINQQFGDNTQISIALLQEAQLLLTNQHDARLYPIMQAIARDKAMLELTPAIDKAALLTQLNTAYFMVQQLKITPPIPKNKVTSSALNQSADVLWRKILDQSLQQLKQLVIIRHHDATIKPLITPTDEAIIRDNIFLALQQAQWATLHQNQAVYDKALAQAICDIKRIFDIDNHQTDILIQQLSKLQSIKFEEKQLIGQESIVLLNQLITATPTPNATKAIE